MTLTHYPTVLRCAALVAACLVVACTREVATPV